METHIVRTVTNLRLPVSLFAGLCAIALTTPASWGTTLFKCKDPSGKTTYSDTDCRPSLPYTAPPRPPRPERKPLPPEPAARVEKLTPAVVESLLQQAREHADKGDFQAACALAAPDLFFTLVDRSSSPETKASGGRADICKLQKESAQAMRASGLTSLSSLSRMKIQVSADGAQATATYLLNGRIFMSGAPAFGIRCDRDDQLGLYEGKVLFKRASSTCTPVP